jgi:hypothetical protein
MSNQFQLSKKVREAVILNLRRIFTGDPDYNYAETIDGEYDFDNTRIVIAAVLSQEPVFFPAITVETVPGQEQRYLGPDSHRTRLDNNKVQISDEMFTSFDMNVTIAVHTIDDLKTKDQIVDRIYDHLKTINDDLADRGIEVKRTTLSQDKRSFNGDRWFITGGLTLEIYTEWHDDTGPGTTLAKIPISLSLIP